MDISSSHLTQIRIEVDADLRLHHSVNLRVVASRSLNLQRHIVALVLKILEVLWVLRVGSFSVVAVEFGDA